MHGVEKQQTRRSLQNTTNSRTTISFTFTRKARRGKRRSPSVLPYFSALRRSSLSLGRRAISMCGRRGARGCVARVRHYFSKPEAYWQCGTWRTHARALSCRSGRGVMRFQRASGTNRIRRGFCVLVDQDSVFAAHQKKDTELLVMFV